MLLIKFKNLNKIVHIKTWGRRKEIMETMASKQAETLQKKILRH
jgi:hypothetical protein